MRLLPLIIIFLLNLPETLLAQNLIINPSFEEYDSDYPCLLVTDRVTQKTANFAVLNDRPGWVFGENVAFCQHYCPRHWYNGFYVRNNGLDTATNLVNHGDYRVKGARSYHGDVALEITRKYSLVYPQANELRRASLVGGSLSKPTQLGKKYFFSVWLSPFYSGYIGLYYEKKQYNIPTNYMASTFAFDLWSQDKVDSIMQAPRPYLGSGQDITKTTAHNRKNNIIEANADSNWTELRMVFIADKSTDKFTFGIYNNWGKEDIVVMKNPYGIKDTFSQFIQRITQELISYFSDAFTLMPYPELGDTLYLSGGDSLLLNPHTPEGDLLWDDSTTASTKKIYCPGTYWVESRSEFTSIRDSVVVLFKEVADVDTTLCQPDAAFSLGKTPYDIRWNTGDTTTRIIPSQEGVYSVDYLLPGGCSIAREVNIAFDTLQFPVISDTVFCTSGKLNFKPHKNHSYRWPDGSSNPEITITKAGDYSLQINTPHCHDSIIINIGIESPEVLKYTDTTLCLEDSFVFAPDLPYDWAWLTEEQTSFTDSSDIIISWQQPLCGAQTDTFRLRFENCGCEAYIANAFSPNGDGLNEGFKPVIACELLEYEFWVYNRWGQLVFHSLDKNTAWQGTDLPVDAYYYLLSYRTAATRKPVFTHGFVQVTK